MKQFVVFFIVILPLLGSGCSTQRKKQYESRYEAAYEYINRCENLTFWKKDICDEKYKDLFPVNIVLDIFGGGEDASGFKPLINYIFYPNKKTNLYVVFSRQYSNTLQAYCIETDNKDLFPYNYMMAGDTPVHDFSFTFIFNKDNSIKTVWHDIAGRYIEE